MPGLSVMARHTECSDIGINTDLEESETNLEAKYQIQGGALEGLNLRLRVSSVRADAAVAEDSDEVRLIANYSF